VGGTTAVPSTVRRVNFILLLAIPKTPLPSLCIRRTLAGVLWSKDCHWIAQKIPLGCWRLRKPAVLTNLFAISPKRAYSTRLAIRSEHCCPRESQVTPAARGPTGRPSGLVVVEAANGGCFQRGNHHDKD
jgi:hypothetical protein